MAMRMNCYVAPKVRNPLSGKPDAELSARCSKSSCIRIHCGFCAPCALPFFPLADLISTSPKGIIKNMNYA